MKLPKKIARYLRGNVDFDSFFVLDIAVQDKKDAVLLLAPRDITTDKFFCIQYRGHSYFYGSIENMMEACVKCQYLRPTAVKRLTRKYHKSAGKACVKPPGKSGQMYTFIFHRHIIFKEGFYDSI